MKKKFVTALLLFALSTGAVACGGNEPGNSDSSQFSEKTISTPVEEINELNSESQSETESTSENDSTVMSEKTLEDIENYLLDKEVLSGERVQKWAVLIGGIDGFMYKDSAGEIYEYDTNSEAYQKLANGEEISLEGMDNYTLKAVSINGKFVLFGDDVSQELIDAFNSFE